MGDAVNKAGDAGRNVDKDLGFCAMDWGGDAGACWECWKLDPCCSDFGTAIYCCLCCCFCGPCTLAKMYSYSLKQDCAWVNHCLYACCCGICAVVCTRHNLRVDKGVGSREMEGWIGDCLIAYCCGPCNMCQLFRAMPKEGWDWLPVFPPKEVYIEPCKLCIE